MTSSLSILLVALTILLGVTSGLISHFLSRFQKKNTDFWNIPEKHSNATEEIMINIGVLSVLSWSITVVAIFFIAEGTVLQRILIAITPAVLSYWVGIILARKKLK